MRFSRSNISGPVNTSGVKEDSSAGWAASKAVTTPSTAPTSASISEVPPGGVVDAMAASSIEGRGELPTWQKAFVLGPNVRFTRTPENAIPKKGAGELGSQAETAQLESVPQPEPQPPAITVATPPRTGAPLIVRPVQRAPAASVATSEPGADARSLMNGLRREFSPAATPMQTIAKAAAEINAQRPAQASTPQQPPAAAQRPPQFAQHPGFTPAAQAPRRPPMTAPQRPQVPPMVAAAMAQASAPQASGATPSSMPAARPAYPAFIPDHLYWEAMSLGASDTDRTRPAARSQASKARAAAAPVTPAAPQAVLPPAAPAPTPAAKRVALPVLDVTGNGDDTSAVLNYREITLRSFETAEAPITIEPVAAPAPVSAVPAASTPSLLLTPQAIRAARSPGLPWAGVQHVTVDGEAYEFPPIELLQEAVDREEEIMSQDALEQSAGLLESVLEDFGVKGEIIDVRPGPVVTLYEFEPAPGVKSSRVIGLSDDIARSMSALSARVAVVPGRNVIGIELPNPERETVYLRELIESQAYVGTGFRLPLCLGKTIGGEPVIAELAKMPHLLVAGTTGSGKSVAINTMILSLLYRLKPEECRLIMVDPKMLELSVYDGIPHLLTPVVTDPKKAVLALKWAVREMEDRYRKMSRLGVRNIDGYNARATSAREKGETIMVSVQSGFDRQTGETLYEQEEMDLSPMPYIVVIVDEMADLMMVAGKEIEGAIQRLAQMARAAGIHLIMATQRPSVDVITGTIKANFPTRISFQVTSKIDSRTILGEQGAEHLLGQGDMLHMVGGGRISRVHGPFVADQEVEKVVAHLKTQGRPQYLGTVTEDTEETQAPAEEEDSAVFDRTAMGTAEEDGDDLYDRAVKVVMRDKKCSTSYIQRRLSIGYNRAASLVERMEQEGLVGPANHVGKRSIIAGGQDGSGSPAAPGEAEF